MADLNRLIRDAGLSTETATSEFNFTPVDSDYPAGTSHLLMTLSFQVKEAFSSDGSWTLELLNSSDTVVATISSSDVTGFGQSGFMQAQVVVPNDGTELTARVSADDAETAVYSSAAFDVALQATALTEEGEFGRLIDGIPTTANAATSSDADSFGFQLDAGEAGTATLTFSAAGSLTVTSTENLVGSNNQAISGVAVTAGQAMTLNLTSAQQFVDVDFTASVAGDYTVTLNDETDRAVGPVSISAGDVTGNDFSQVVQNSDSGLTLAIDDDGSVALAELFSSNVSGASLYLYTNGTALNAVDGDTTRAISTDAASPTLFTAAELNDFVLQGSSIPSGSSGITLTAFFQAPSDLTVNDANSDRLDLLRSSVLEAKLVQESNGISLSIDDTSIDEGQGSDATLTISLDSAATEATVVSLVNFSGDLELGAGDDSIESVSFAVGEQTKTISVNAFEGDNDFETAEEVEITAEVTQGVTELVVEPLTVTVSETVPVFSLTASSQGVLVSGSDTVRFDLQLDNASEFTSQSVTLALSTTSDFFVGDAADPTSSSVSFDLDSDSATASLYVTVSGTSISAVNATSQLQGTVTVGSQQIDVALPQMSVVRAQSSNESQSAATISGTSQADTFFASQGNDSISGLAGDDQLTLSSNAELQGSFNGGAGSDTLVLPGNRADYSSSVDGAVTTLSIDGSQDSLELRAVELIDFADETGVSVANLNSPPTANASALANDFFSLDEAETVSIDLNSVFSDPDGDDLLFQVSATSGTLPAWIALNASTGMLTASPGYDDATASSFDIEIKATDQATFGDDAASLTRTVTVANVNQLPQWVNVPSQVVAPDSIGTLDLDLASFVSDADGQDLTLSVTSTLPDWLTFSAENNALTSATAPSESGSVEVTVQASDGEDSASATFTINVTSEIEATLGTVQSGEAVSLDVSTVTAGFGVEASDLTITWETSADGTTWAEDTSASGLSATFNAGDSATFVRAKVEADNQDALYTEAQLVKSSGAVVRGTFDGVDGTISASAVDLSGLVVRDGQDDVSITNFGHEPGSMSLPNIPTGTFGLTLASTSEVAPDVGINDVISTLRAIVGLDTLSSKQTIAADMNEDGDVGISDVISMLRQIVGLDDSDGFVGAAEQSDGSYSTDLTSADVDSVLWIGKGDLDSSLNLDLV